MADQTARWAVQHGHCYLVDADNQILFILSGGQKGPWLVVRAYRGLGHGPATWTTPALVSESFQTAGWEIVGPIPGSKTDPSA